MGIVSNYPDNLPPRGPRRQVELEAVLSPRGRERNRPHNYLKNKSMLMEKDGYCSKLPEQLDQGGMPSLRPFCLPAAESSISQTIRLHNKGEVKRD